MSLIHWESTVFALIAFVILYLLLSKYAFGPLFSIMEKRRELVKEQMDGAARDRESAEALLAEQRKAMENVRQEAFDILEQARKTSAKQAEELIASAKAESARIKEEALKDIENEKKQAVAALRSQVSAMSVMIASKIIEKQVDEKSQEQLINQYLNEVGGKQ